VLPAGSSPAHPRAAVRALAVNRLPAGGVDHAKALAVSLAYRPRRRVAYVMARGCSGLWWLPAWAGSPGGCGVRRGPPRAAAATVLPLRGPRREPLRDRLLALRARAGVPALGVFEWRIGDRTSRANARPSPASGARGGLSCRTRSSPITGPEEVEAVLAHELAHHVHHDIWKGLAVDAAAAMVALLAAGTPCGRAGADGPSPRLQIRRACRLRPGRHGGGPGRPAAAPERGSRARTSGGRTHGAGPHRQCRGVCGRHSAPGRGRISAEPSLRCWPGFFFHTHRPLTTDRVGGRLTERPGCPAPRPASGAARRDHQLAAHGAAAFPRRSGGIEGDVPGLSARNSERHGPPGAARLRESGTRPR